MNRRAVLVILICLSIKGVNTDQESFDHRSPYKPAIQNFSSLSSSKMSSNGTSNDNCITCKQPVRPRQEGLQCDGCQKWNHRTCNTGISRQAYRAAVQTGTEVEWHCDSCAVEWSSLPGEPVAASSRLENIDSWESHLEQGSTVDSIHPPTIEISWGSHQFKGSTVVTTPVPPAPLPTEQKIVRFMNKLHH
ncbi:uncharacterized protein [Pocillopora verrucosa]|uniref:uncharacterized protein isoform X2 n=1 Tax=Pocillopora verrucosa TaxID=203993 RepID=UPI003341C282